MPTYEFSEGSSSKFWAIELDGTAVTTTYGRIGTTGQTTRKEYDSEEKARKEHDKLVAEKVKKGYRLAGGAAPNRSVGARVDVDHLYAELTKRGWKFDTEESDLFTMLNRTFWAEGVKVYVILEGACSVPPNDETEVLEEIRFHRFDTATFPRTSMEELLLEDLEDEDRQRLLDDHGEKLRHGDPQSDSFDDLEEVDAAQVDASVRASVDTDLTAAVRIVE